MTWTVLLWHEFTTKSFCPRVNHWHFNWRILDSGKNMCRSCLSSRAANSLTRWKGHFWFHCGITVEATRLTQLPTPSNQHRWRSVVARRYRDGFKWAGERPERRWDWRTMGSALRFGRQRLREGIKWRVGSLVGGLRWTWEGLVPSWPVGSCSRHSSCYSPSSGTS